MTRQLLTLMHNGICVDCIRLDIGIYEAVVPSLFGKDETIESLVELYKKIYKNTKEIEDNLSRCRLQPITITDESAQPSPGYTKEQIKEFLEEHLIELEVMLSGVIRQDLDIADIRKNVQDYTHSLTDEQLFSQLPPAKDAGVLVQAMNDIQNPIEYLTRKAKEDGGILDGQGALMLIKSAELYKTIASNALTQYNNPS